MCELSLHHLFLFIGHSVLGQDSLTINNKGIVLTPYKSDTVLKTSVTWFSFPNLIFDSLSDSAFFSNPEFSNLN
ncbi:MAG: hypothetical protein CK539_06205 [Flavobacteriales bacterium]|nr:MAG: hypothetical protein CK539_06205 [Flavobacteriales bacterium]